ncbi:ImmA/IrrE family metallo-endopeptidase [Pseudoalteromonas sp. SWN29]|uniref:ImmA/IrrE family metallo-endopeptidase n=1 Tax=Pseudoalteromonas sp. SWN29 TaxID=2792064 RepID=UPI0018CEB9CB|nr:ImmA/IrrE family metallo-endopeptidase [Pseudoalteromonas sp. SWN29]MBH0027292.1 ImmA/IrrE family metallo-endopeptidase [Pseudoalteromonas sp. SWN29]
MSKVDLNKLDDFFVTSDSVDSLNDLIESYSEYEKQLERIPKKITISDDVSKLKFFREVHSNRKSEALYRKRDDANSALAIYWLSRVKELAAFYASYNNVVKFEGINKDSLKEVAQLSSDVRNLNILEDYFAERGIILVTEPSLPGLKLDGAVFILSSGQAVVSLSLRYKRLDNFWFTLMHELAHLCLHVDKLVSPIIEDLDSEAKSIIELEADKLALNSFVPRNIWRNCPPKYNFSEESVIDFANQMGIHPTIVAGRLRKELNRYDLLSKMVNGINVQEYFA